VCTGREESQSLQPEGVVEKTIVAESAQSQRGSNNWSVFEEVSQGVHAGIFPKGLEDFSIKIKRASVLKCWKKTQRYRFASG
jgi:hypothetical protein